MIRGRIFYGWIVLGVAFLAVLTSTGLRSSYGVFIKPLEGEFGWDRASLSLAASFSLLLYGLGGAFIGKLVDLYGPRRVFGFSLLVLGVAYLLSTFLTQLWHLVVLYGFLGAMASGGAGIVTASTLVARWFQQRRSLAMGVCSAGMSAGQLIVIPLSMFLVLALGWRQAYLLLGAGVLLLVMPLVLTLVRSDPASLGLLPYGAENPDGVSGRPGGKGDARWMGGTEVSEASPRQAIRTRPFWLLALGYCGCGFTTSGLVVTHLVPFLIERGFDAMTAANALGLMGGFNIGGSLLAGLVAERFGRKNPLALVYMVRGLCLLLLITVTSPGMLMVFAILYGMNEMATIPLTSALTANFFGVRSLGTIYGAIFLSHQVGSALSSYLGGVVFDRSGGYEPFFLAAALVAMGSATLSFLLRERPRQKVGAAAALP